MAENDVPWTAGVWYVVRPDRVDDEGDNDWDIRCPYDPSRGPDEDDWEIATAHGGMPEVTANARLIAAAPGLYEALADLVAANEAVQLALCDGPDVPGFDPSELSRAQAAVSAAEEVAKAALAKARGE